MFGKHDKATEVIREVPVNSFAVCCGAKIMGRFFERPTAKEKKQFAEQMTTYGKYLLCCTLKTEQYNAWGETIEAEGFKIVATWKNPNTQAILRMLVRNGSPATTRAPRKRKTSLLGL